MLAPGWRGRSGSGYQRRAGAAQAKPAETGASGGLHPPYALLLCQPILLCHQPETDHGEVMIERVCKPNTLALHDREAGGVDRRELVQVGASEVFPRLFQIARLAGKNRYGSRLIDCLFPGQRHVPVGVSIEKCEFSMTTGTDV